MATEPSQAPTERAPMLIVYGDLAGRVAGLVRALPTLMARLIVAPQEAVHATAAYLYLAPNAAGSDADVAATINDTDPRALVNAALPGCPPTLYRALDRAGDRVQSRQFYERLGHLSRGPFADVLLAGDRRLDLSRLDYYEALTTMDPAIHALRAVLPESTYEVEGLDAMLAFLRARGALHEDDLRLPPKAGLGGVVRRLRVVLARLHAPDPGFTPPAGYRLVRSTEELQVIGRAFRNCVALPQHHAGRHHLSLVTGSAVYLASDAPPLLVALQHVEGSLWVLEQMVGPRNAAPPAGAREALVRSLTAAGLRIIATDPASALSRLAASTTRLPRFLVPVGEDGDDEVGDGELAA